MARLLWICGAGHLGGAERVTLTLLEALQRRGRSVTAITRRGSPVTAAAHALALPVRAVPLHGPARICGALPLRRILSTPEPAIALVTTADEWVTTCLARPRTSAVALVLVRHMVLPLPARVCALAGRRADAVVAVSAAVRTGLLTNPGISPSQMHVISNPVRFPTRDALPNAGRRATARATLGQNAAGAWVGFFGGDAPAKGLADVLIAVAAANGAVGPTNLLVGGPTPLGAFSVPNALRDRVYRLGDPERMADALTAVDVVVAATHSSLGEALPATVMEAMALGTPVLAYATGGVAEVVGSDGRAGCLVPADDVTELSRALTALLASPAERSRLATAALTRTRHHFDPTVAAAAYEALFDTVTTQRRTSRQ